jgi:predicted small secreted protein
MMQKLKNLFSVLVLAGFVAGVVGSLGCNTMKGVGRDIERAGEKTQDAAEDVRRRM